MLLSLEQVQFGLAEKFAGYKEKFPALFAERVPKRATDSVSQDTINVIEREIGRKLPPSFERMLKAWDFGNFSIASINFSTKERYAEQFIAYNKNIPGVRWWEDQEDETRPSDFVMIAQGDPFVVLLELSTGQIFAYVTDNGSESRVPVAPGIEMFLRALGTVELKIANASSPSLFIDAVVAELGNKVSNDFWTELGMCRADV